MLLLSGGLSIFAQIPDEPALIAELGCANCHTDLKIASPLKEKTPDLSSAGLRYNPAYLFDFLQNPVKVRRHLGRARMPDFHLGEKEALALVAFLQAQRGIPGKWPALPTEIGNQLMTPMTQVSKEQFQAEVGKGLICFTCHTLEGKGGVLGIELGNIGYRLQREWVKTYLVFPAMFGVPATVMPPQFYQLSPDATRFQELTPGAAHKIQVLSDYLFSLDTQKRRALEQQFNSAKAKAPEVTAAIGERIFKSQNCAACHRHQTIQPRLQAAAPDLAMESKRVTERWLDGYLKHSGVIRPFGYNPGDGSRMPDFRLADDEASQVTRFLMAARSDSHEFQAQKLSAFLKRKAALLLSEKLSCLGCHRLGQGGGRIGPDLSMAATRLQPDYVYAMIKDPRTLNPHTIMPRLPLTLETMQLIANFLLQQEAAAADVKYLSLIDNPTIAIDSDGTEATARETYFKHCAPCHGSEGQGNGFNAQFLPVRPTLHADEAYMSARPDDTLYDAISSGGYVMNKSQMMPPWRDSFTPNEIKGLVGYLRTLCRCQGPSWSLDNAKR